MFFEVRGKFIKVALQTGNTPKRLGSTVIEWRTSIRKHDIHFKQLQAISVINLLEPKLYVECRSILEPHCILRVLSAT